MTYVSLTGFCIYVGAFSDAFSIISIVENTFISSRRTDMQLRIGPIVKYD